MFVLCFLDDLLGLLVLCFLDNFFGSFVLYILDNFFGSFVLYILDDFLGSFVLCFLDDFLGLFVLCFLDDLLGLFVLCFIGLFVEAVETVELGIGIGSKPDKLRRLFFPFIAPIGGGFFGNAYDFFGSLRLLLRLLRFSRARGFVGLFDGGFAYSAYAIEFGFAFELFGGLFDRRLFRLLLIAFLIRDEAVHD